MTKRFVLLTTVAALSASIFSGAPASALDISRSDGLGFACNGTYTHCVNRDVLAVRQTKVPAFLKKNGYPSEIVVEDSAMLPKIKAGWNVRSDCFKIPAPANTGDDAVNKAKVIYCLVKSRGLKVSVPTISLAGK